MLQIASVIKKLSVNQTIVQVLVSNRCEIDPLVVDPCR